MSNTWFNKDDLIKIIPGKIIKTKIVLDIGCGIMPQKYVTPKTHICCDPYLEYLNVLKKTNGNKTDTSFIYIHSDWETVLKILPEKSIDTIFLLDIIEHVEKQEALKLLKLSEKIARVQIVVFTTLGFIKQEHIDGKDAWGLSGGKFQKHKSGWYPEDFGEGWETYSSKNYHFENNLGIKYKKPHGAIWAIRNFQIHDKELKKRTIDLVISKKVMDFINSLLKK